MPSTRTTTDWRDLDTLPVWAANGTSVASILGLSRASAYRVIREGLLPVVDLGSRRVVVTTRAIRRLLGELPLSDADLDALADAEAGQAS